MGGGSSKKDRDKVNVYKIVNAKKKVEPSLTMILLGTGGVGKSTVHKQVCRTFGKGESAQKMLEAIDFVRTLMTKVTENVCNQLCDKLENTPEDEKSEGCPILGDDFFEMIDEMQRISNCGTKDRDHYRLMQIMVHLWNEPAVRTTYEMMNGQGLEAEMKAATFDMFSDRIEELFHPEFTLSATEYIKIRQPTTGMERSVGTVKNKGFTLIDVGGQIHFQEEWDSIIRSHKDMPMGILFMVSLDDYRHAEKMEAGQRSNFARLTVKEGGLKRNITADKDLNLQKRVLGARLKMAICNWEKQLNSDILTNPDPVPIILLLNKVDLFRQNLHVDPAIFHKVFHNVERQKDQEGVAEYEDRCIRAVRKKFERAYRHSLHAQKSKLPLKWYVTMATDNAMVASILEKYVQSLSEANMLMAGYG